MFIKKNFYEVQFFWHTDMRCHWDGEADSEVEAYAKALKHHRFESWCDGEGFFVKIKYSHSAFSLT